MKALEQMIAAADANDAARAVEQMVQADPQRAVAYIVVGLVMVVGAFTWAGIKAAR